MSEDAKEAPRSGSSTAAPETTRDRLRVLLTPRRLEIAAFVLLAIVPLVPYLAFLLRGVPRFMVFGDFALIEHEIRHVGRGETLLGLGSRFGWSHPGPLFFYFVAPFQWLFGTSSTGLYVGTCALSMLAFGWLAGAARALQSRATAIAVLLGIALWLTAFGNIAANPWNRVVAVAPLVAYVGFCALLARGSSAMLLPVVFFGSVVMQTHISTVTTVGALGVLAFVVFCAQRWSSRRRSAAAYRARFLFTGREWRRIAIAAGLLALFSLPMVIEELRAPPQHGNISKLLYFLRHREEPYRQTEEILRNWALATSWLPDRILSLTLLDEGAHPMMMRWDVVPKELSQTAKTLTFLHVASALIALGVSIKRRDWTSLTFLTFGVAGEVLGIYALRAVVGEDQYSLFFWLTGPCTMTWVGVISTLASWCAERFAEPILTIHRSMKPVLVTFGVVLLLGVTGLQRNWMTRTSRAPASGPEHSTEMRDLLTDIEERLDHDRATPVIHLFGAWPVAAAIALELEKDGRETRYANVDAWSFAGGRTADGVAKPLHLWFVSPDLALPIAPCLEKVASRGGFTAYGGPGDIAPNACDSSRPNASAPSSP